MQNVDFSYIFKCNDATFAVLDTFNCGQLPQENVPTVTSVVEDTVSLRASKETRAVGGKVR